MIELRGRKSHRRDGQSAETSDRRFIMEVGQLCMGFRRDRTPAKAFLEKVLAAVADARLKYRDEIVRARRRKNAFTIVRASRTVALTERRCDEE